MEGDAACTLQEPSDLESLRVNKEEVCCWPRTNTTKGLCQPGQKPVIQQKEQKSEVISGKEKTLQARKDGGEMGQGVQSGPKERRALGQRKARRVVALKSLEARD